MKRLNPVYVDSTKRRTLTHLVTIKANSPKHEIDVNITEAPYGAKLGDHYHISTKEYFYIVKGTLTYNKKELLKKGDLFLVEPEEMHTLVVSSDKASFLTFLTEPFNVNKPDLHK